MNSLHAPCGKAIMNAMTKLSFLALFLTLVDGCALTASKPSRSEPDIFRVGEVEVRLYQDRAAMVRQLPPLFALLEATKVGNTKIQVSGYYDKQSKTIYAINDAKTVIHEFKHYLEPEWKHGVEPARSVNVLTPSATQSIPIHVPAPITQTGNKKTTAEDKVDF
jgi:hypothetical protein